MSDLDYDAHKALVRGPIREQDATFGDDRLPPKFWNRATVLPNGCWQWIGSISRTGTGSGYGRYSDVGKLWQAHRASYIALVGEIPADRPLLDHLCRNRACVRPSHLEPVTNRENTRRGLRPAQIRNGDMCRNGLQAQAPRRTPPLARMPTPLDRPTCRQSQVCGLGRGLQVRARERQRPDGVRRPQRVRDRVGWGHRRWRDHDQGRRPVNALKRLRCWLSSRHRASAGYCQCGLTYTYAYAEDDGL